MERREALLGSQEPTPTGCSPEVPPAHTPAQSLTALACDERPPLQVKALNETTHDKGLAKPWQENVFMK